MVRKKQPGACCEYIEIKACGPRLTAKWESGECGPALPVITRKGLNEKVIRLVNMK
jgi:hypothetical protein